MTTTYIGRFAVSTVMVIISGTSASHLWRYDQMGYNSAALFSQFPFGAGRIAKASG